ncbi:hypothetical protein N7495_007872 [Penicillium taxi]|uniref:uncharacterized protein n=1 Tax=Penicillium taxi TaxID=168475 RepID=UPI0025453CBF|nr:uncharacterized protein N7495_007872 [Penicillium taxi]KAJ5887831.1 hypothetical protein N7495_007872 [Penicillium taxi]
MDVTPNAFIPTVVPSLSVNQMVEPPLTPSGALDLAAPAQPTFNQSEFDLNTLTPLAESTPWMGDFCSLVHSAELSKLTTPRLMPSSHSSSSSPSPWLSGSALPSPLDLYSTSPFDTLFDAPAILPDVTTFEIPKLANTTTTQPSGWRQNMPEYQSDQSFAYTLGGIGGEAQFIQ